MSRNTGFTGFTRMILLNEEASRLTVKRPAALPDDNEAMPEIQIKDVDEESDV